MKTYKHLYPQVCDFENLYLAYRKARKGKRGEIFDALDIVFGKQKTAHLRHIQPFIGCAFDAPVVQVETIYIDVCFHMPLNTETAVRRSRTRFVNETTTGGYASIIVRSGDAVKETCFLFHIYQNLACSFSLCRVTPTMRQV